MKKTKSAGFIFKKQFLDVDLRKQKMHP